MIEEFIEQWNGKGTEKSDTQVFWLGLLRDVLGIEKPDTFIEFEKEVELSHISFIDAYIPSTRIIIEQKSIHSALLRNEPACEGTQKHKAQTPAERE